MRLTLNLASRRYVNERALKLFCLALTLLLVLLLILQGQLLLQSREHNLAFRANIEKLQVQLSGKIPERFTKEQIAVQQQEFAQAKAILQQDAFRWTALFDRMEKLLPKNVSITSFSPNYKSGSLMINGVAKNLIDLQDLLDNLHADSFSQVFLKNQSQIEVLDYQDQKHLAIQFSIQLEGVF
ncbi:PilN domain-containing protein [Malonomonas rubra]|uniref:PilN domain-containing protein n=1 Tax=Malonomonas rubra TaxID=57040 RepID=UPI0026EBAAFC|nr:PilN domain-containing protein [Malonomonas rubra]